MVESFHLLATLAFVVGSAVVSVRLLMLARRTGEQPELLLGSAIFGTAVGGYGLLIGAAILRGGDLSAETATPLTVGMTAAGRLLHTAGVSAFLLFVLRVFYPQGGAARGVAAIAGLLLWVGVVWGGFAGSFSQDHTGHASWWCEYLVVWTYPLWQCGESLRYWAKLRRRVAIGLADPMVTNRFALWGTSSIFTCLAIWSASSPAFLRSQPELLLQLTPAIHVTTALTGLVSVSCSYLAFLPPHWYARWIRSAAEPSPA